MGQPRAGEESRLLKEDDALDLKKVKVGDVRDIQVSLEPSCEPGSSVAFTSKICGSQL